MPDYFSTTINATTEVALERAMFLLGSSRRGREDDVIEWLDMELPVSPLNADRLDLIGRLKKKGTFIICEVKFGNSFNPSYRTKYLSSPELAANEVVQYYEMVRKNLTFVTDQHHYTPNDEGIKGKEFDWEKVVDGKTELIVVANAAYWAYWLGHRGLAVPTSGKAKNGRKRKVKCYSIDIPFDYFEKQSKGTLYKPQIDNDKLEVL